MLVTVYVLLCGPETLNMSTFLLLSQLQNLYERTLRLFSFGLLKITVVAAHVFSVAQRLSISRLYFCGKLTCCIFPKDRAGVRCALSKINVTTMQCPVLSALLPLFRIIQNQKSLLCCKCSQISYVPQACLFKIGSS